MVSRAVRAVAPRWQGRIYRGTHRRASHPTNNHSSPSQAGPELRQKLLQRAGQVWSGSALEFTLGGVQRFGRESGPRVEQWSRSVEYEICQARRE